MNKTSSLPSRFTQVVRIYWLLAYLAAVLLAVLLWITISLDILLSWLAAINLVALLAYGYDKSIAGTRRTRLPEKLLLALAYSGGSLGALIGMRIFHHKTSKTSFQVRFWIIMILQIGLLLVYLFFIKPDIF